MDRHRTCKGLQGMGGISPQASLPVPRGTDRQNHAVAAEGKPDPVLAFSPVGTCSLAATPGRSVPLTFTFAPQSCLCPSQPGFMNQVNASATSATHRTPSGARTQRARAISIAAFSLHRPRAGENVALIDNMPVHISDARPEWKTTKQCLQPRRCGDDDLRFSFPQGDYLLHFLFLSARIGLGRPVKED